MHHPVGVGRAVYSQREVEEAVASSDISRLTDYHCNAPIKVLPHAPTPIRALEGLFSAI